MENVLPPQSPNQPAVITQQTLAAKKSPLLIVVILIAIISVAVSGLLYWNNQQLKKQLMEKMQTDGTTGYIDSIIPPPDIKTTPRPLTNWKTYTDPENMFSLQYPGEAVISYQNIGPSKIVRLVLIGPTQKASGRTQTELFDGYAVSVQTTPMTEVYDIKAAAAKSRQGILDVGYGTECKVTPVISGLLDNTVTAEFSAINCMTSSRMIFAVKNSLIYEISGLYSGDNYLSTVNQILSAFKFSDGMTNANDSDVLIAAKKYLDAYVSGNWTVAKQYGDSQLNEAITAGYGLTKYEITGSNADANANNYHVYVKFTDKTGRIYEIEPHSTDKPLEVLMVKENGVWKAVTWYFFE